MFANAIENAANYTRAFHIIRRRYGDNAIFPDCGTLFFVNDQGDALTAKHIAAAIPAADQMEKKYKAFLEERGNLKRDASFRFEEKLLEKKYGFGKDGICQIRNTFVDCVEGGNGFSLNFHPKYDLALIHFNDPTAMRYRGHAVFSKEAPKQGQSMCCLGFPFPEYTNFQYNTETDNLEFTKSGAPVSPRFPLDGMVTRFLRDEERFFGIEMSSPGLPGQSGGPLFNNEGHVFGMQYSTKIAHINSDVVDKEILVGNSLEKVTDYGFLRLGQYVHVDVIRDFLRTNNIQFFEE
jgi:hypothetical protein